VNLWMCPASGRIPVKKSCGLIVGCRGEGPPCGCLSDLGLRLELGLCEENPTPPHQSFKFPPNYFITIQSTPHNPVSLTPPYKCPFATRIAPAGALSQFFLHARVHFWNTSRVLLVHFPPFKVKQPILYSATSSSPYLQTNMIITPSISPPMDLLLRPASMLRNGRQLERAKLRSITLTFSEMKAIGLSDSFALPFQTSKII
jgi:hypothetical protein